MTPRGALLGNRYELGSVVATGGMGQVWRARDTVLGRPVAVKLLRREFTGSPTFLTRFRAEAQHAAALNHPNIAAVHDYGEMVAAGDSVAYLVMELVEGESLAALLARVGRLDPARTLGIVRQAAAGLAVAHAAGVVHRDVKPANVLVRPDGVVKLTDFGIAWSAASVPVTRTGQVIGTAAYLAPEQALGEKATPASDVYALGMVAYECLTGQPAFDGETSVRVAQQQIHDQPAPLPSDVPAGLRRLIDAALVKDPEQRIPDGAALLAAADAVAAAPALPVAPAVPAAAVPAAAVPAADPAAESAAASAGATAVLPSSPPRHRSGLAATAVLPVADPSASAPAPPPPAAPRPTPSATVKPSAGSGRRRRGWALLAAAVGVVALVLLGAVVLGLRNAGSTATAASTAPSPRSSSLRTATDAAPPPPTTVEVVPADYLGRPVEEVRARLTALGLQVRVTPVRTDTVAAGLVVAIDPGGALTPGQVVNVSGAVAPPQPTAWPTQSRGNGNGDGKGGAAGGDQRGHGKGHHRSHGGG